MTKLIRYKRSRGIYDIQKVLGCVYGVKDSPEEITGPHLNREERHEGCVKDMGRWFRLIFMGHNFCNIIQTQIEGVIRHLRNQ